jgi:uncharacterized damage-inducible protein DinB
MTEPDLPEPWLRGTLSELDPVIRAVIHALELAREDLWKWCYPLSIEELNERRVDLAPVAFHLRHIAGSLDRLLTYAEGRELSEEQWRARRTELEGASRKEELFAELSAALEHSESRVRAIHSSDFVLVRKVGQKQLPTSVGGLLVHIADHTQRHVGQAITTAKIMARR